MTSTVFSRTVVLRARVVRIALCMTMATALALSLSACGHAADGSTSAASQQQAATENQSQEQSQEQEQGQGQGQAQAQRQGQDAVDGVSPSERKALQALDISKVSVVREQNDESAHRLSYTLAFDVTNNGDEKVSFAPSMTADLYAKDAYGDSVKADSRMSLPMTQTYDDIQASDVVLTGGSDGAALSRPSTIGFISYLEPGATKHCQATVETSLATVTSGGKTIRPAEATASNFEIRVRLLGETPGTNLVYSPYDKTIAEGEYEANCRFYPTEQDAIEDGLPFAVKAGSGGVSVSFSAQHDDGVNGDSLMMTVANNTGRYLKAVRCTVRYDGSGAGAGSGVPSYIARNLGPGETQTQSVNLISLEAGDQIPAPVYSEYVVDPGKQVLDSR